MGHSAVLAKKVETLANQTLIGTGPDNVQLDGSAGVLEDVLRVRVVQLRGVQVIQAHHAVADVKYTFAGCPNRYLKQSPIMINDSYILLIIMVFRLLIEYLLTYISRLV